MVTDRPCLLGLALFDLCVCTLNKQHSCKLFLPSCSSFEQHNTFLQNWNQWTCLIHPPVVLLPQILRKIRKNQATALLITPNWSGQPWFPELIQIVVDQPLMLPQLPSLLSLPFQPAVHHPLWQSLHQAVWPLSEIVMKQKAF